MPLFTPQEEHEHNQRVLKALAYFYAYHTAAGNDNRAQMHYRRYMDLLMAVHIGLDTDNAN